MDWLTKMNLAIDYIEENLTQDINFNEVAMRACCSSYNFQRMFAFITDISLAEYIRRRRMTQAALELQNSNSKVIDVAIKYGYDSATSFARTFKALHGLTPTQSKQDGVKLKAFPKISFQISIKGDKEMDYRIETKEAFDIFGIETIVSLTGENGYLSPAELWQTCQKNGEYDRLLSNAGDLPTFLPQDLCKIHGAEYYRKTEENTFPYMLCSFVSKSSNTKGYKTIHIPAQTYVVLESPKFKWGDEFFKVLTTLQKRFYSEWLPTANYERADSANFEIYGGTEKYGYIELWYPIIKK
ncbi:AraC family transcriptional regulator [Vallitalea guaymasensis]|uniref:AraC family transcriptional regulator n=1 Tax=Vallitalea guaymasensis TaxID=1185412 RepID=A0A8J8M972_9FIRM|nr:AraC family transcriptional regulator [Vallitalea guaymasensis]QUH28528.1 AraC family transcriptional regulator [Vallitalea guaymasensis]